MAALDDFAGAPATMVYGSTSLVTTAERANDSAVSDSNTRHDNGAMTDPDVIANVYLVIAAPLEEFVVIAKIKTELA